VALRRIPPAGLRKPAGFILWSPDLANLTADLTAPCDNAATQTM
jgi:hypothetical protein